MRLYSTKGQAALLVFAILALIGCQEPLPDSSEWILDESEVVKVWNCKMDPSISIKHYKMVDEPYNSLWLFKGRYRAFLGNYRGSGRAKMEVLWNKDIGVDIQVWDMSMYGIPEYTLHDPNSKQMKRMPLPLYVNIHLMEHDTGASL